MAHSNDCTGGAGLTIGAKATTVDLNGFVLTGDNTGFPAGVDNSGGFNRVKVKNGAIEGFSSAVRSEGGDGLELNHLNRIPRWRFCIGG